MIKNWEEYNELFLGGKNGNIEAIKDLLDGGKMKNYIWKFFRGNTIIIEFNNGDFYSYELTDIDSDFSKLEFDRDIIFDQFIEPDCFYTKKTKNVKNFLKSRGFDIKEIYLGEK